ncbi:41394_t:CDS:1, partial [Gigaspora margarita]
TSTTIPKDIDYQIMSKIHFEDIISDKFALIVEGSLTIYSVNYILKHIIRAENNL